MSDNRFKEYIENRTAAEIMADYGEQRDEWKILPMTKKDHVGSLHHSNGKTYVCEQYEPKDKEYVIKDELLDILSGKTIEQQMDYYYVTESRRLFSTAYGEITKDDLNEKAVKLSDYDGVIHLLIKSSILIGAKIEAYWGDGILLPEKPVCTYYASDNEGSGTKEREDYAYLLFIK